MALNAAAATNTAEAVADALEAEGLIAGNTPEEVADNKASAIDIWTTILTPIFAGIAANAVVDSGIAVQVSLSTGTGTTTGTGTLT